MKTLRFYSLDSAHWVEIFRACRSKEMRKSVISRINHMAQHGAIPVICFHHLMEFINHDSENEVRDRLVFIGEIEVFAQISAWSNRGVPGTIIDIQARELNEHIRDVRASCSEVQTRISHAVFELVRDRQLVNALMENLPCHRSAIKALHKNSAVTASISQSVTLRAQERALFNASAPVNDEKKILENLALLQSRLANELRARGDLGIENTDNVSSSFFAEIASGFSANSAMLGSVTEFLRSFGLDSNDTSGIKTLTQLEELVEFREKLKVCAKAHGLTERDALKADQNKLPSWIIQRSLRRHRQLANRIDGSDIVDSYMLCLAPYCSHVFVDKRTAENVRRILTKEPGLAFLFSNVKKDASWERALNKVYEGI